IHGEAQELIRQIIEQKRFRARSAVGLWPCNSVGDDIELYADADRSEVIGRFHCLRQQKRKSNADTYRSLSDYIAPKDSGRIDYCGAFVNTIHGVETFAKTYQDQNDDYTS